MNYCYGFSKKLLFAGLLWSSLSLLSVTAVAQTSPSYSRPADVAVTESVPQNTVVLERKPVQAGSITINMKTGESTTDAAPLGARNSPLLAGIPIDVYSCFGGPQNVANAPPYTDATFAISLS